MRERVRLAVGRERPWIATLVRGARTRFAAPPPVDELAAWLWTRPALREAAGERTHVVRYATPAPGMRESPWPVPALATTRELATWLGIELDVLDVLADQRGISRAAAEQRRRHYRYAWIPKPRGGFRLVEAPKPRLRAVQRRVLHGILAHVPPHTAAHGFRAGHSVAGAAAVHVGRAVVIRVDLQAFFASVFAARIVGILRTAGYPEPVAWTLAALCTHRTPADVLDAAPERDPYDLARLRMPHLPQGAPTSGALANLAAYRLDVRVAALAARIGARYTRYADDLVLSGDRSLVRGATTLVARLATIAAEEGFALNVRKTRVMTARSQQRITGLVVNDKLAVPRAEVERLRAILHNCARFGPDGQNREGHPDFRAHLQGRVAWIESIDPAKGARLRDAFARIAWPG